MQMHFVQQKCCWLWSRNCVNALQNIGEVQRQQKGLNGKSESLLHRVWKIFAPENGKAEFSILFCWSGEINTSAQNIGVQLEITIWVTWFISSFESQTARLQLLSQCSQAGALCLFLVRHTKVSSVTKVRISVNYGLNLTLKHSFHFDGIAHLRLRCFCLFHVLSLIFWNCQVAIADQLLASWGALFVPSDTHKFYQSMNVYQ